MNSCPETWAWSTLQAALASGPQPRGVLAQAVYGEHDEHARRAVGQLLRRLIERGLLIRVAVGEYALPGTPPRPPRSTFEDLRSMLERRRATAAELARRLARPVATVYHWLQRLRRAARPDGAILRVALAPHALWPWRHNGRVWERYPIYVYWIARPIGRPVNPARLGRPVAA